MFVWKQLEQLVKTTYTFITAQLRVHYQMWASLRTNPKVVFKSCFLFLEDTKVNYADAPEFD